MTPSSRRGVAGALLTFVILLSSIALAQPAADAQPPEFVGNQSEEFARLDFRESCAADQRLFNPDLTITIPGLPPQTVSVCAPPGFNPVHTEALCDLHGGASGWNESPRVCATGYFFGHVVDRPNCRYPLVWLEDFELTRGRAASDYCAVPVLSSAAPGRPPAVSVTAICIEDSVVQQDASAGTLRAGDTFTSSITGTNHTIVLGGPTCTFGCHDGFDTDCDGKLGDYCPVEADFRTVAGAAACLELLSKPS